MAINVSPTASKPTHHLKLSKKGQEVGIILTDGQGRADNSGYQRNPYPTSALKIYQGQEKYADTELPYRPIVQDNWNGGRGARLLDDDVSKYADGWRVDATRVGRLILGPQETYSHGTHRLAVQAMPGKVVFTALTGANRFIARSTLPIAAGFTATRFEVHLRKIGSPADLTVAIYTDSAGSPGSLVGSAYYDVSISEVTDTLSVLFSKSPLASPALGLGTTYWILLGANPADTDANHWEVGTNPDAATDTKVSANGSTWSAGTRALYFRILDGKTNLNSRLFEYKRAWYAVTRPADGSQSRVYLNGDRGTFRGVFDATKFYCTVKTWDVDEWTGCVVLITRGPGSEETQPWRKITGNEATYLEVDTPWLVTHTEDTEFVILGSYKWTSTLLLGAQCTDFAVTDQFVYFARGETSGYNILRWEGYAAHSGGTSIWTDRTEEEDLAAEVLLATQEPGGTILWMTRNEHEIYGTMMIKASVPPRWGKLYASVATLAETNTPWDAWVVANVTQATQNTGTKITVAAGFGTGIVAVENLPAPVDITAGKKLGMLFYSDISTANIGDLQLVLDDSPNLGKTYSPVGLTLYDGSTADSLDLAKDGDASTEEDIAAMTTAKQIYVGFSAQFNKITVDLGATANAVASTLTVEYFNGSAWVALTITDGTASGGATFAVDGSITWTAPYSWEKNTHNSLEMYWIRLKTSANWTANVKIKEITLARNNNLVIDLPVLSAGAWAWITLPMSPLQWALPDCTQIQSVGIKVAVDNGAQVLRMMGGIKILRDLHTIDLPNEARIIGLEKYAGSRDDPREIPWVITEAGLGKIENTEGTDVFSIVSLHELAGLRSELNGVAHCVNGVYLYFNMGERVERYYNQQLDDVGPTSGEGLPENRRGLVQRLVSYPDRVIAAINAGDGYSSVLANKGGWHEIYRAHRANLPIYDVAVQTIPGTVSRLWISQGPDLLSVPISINPQTERNYTYTHESAIITAKIAAGLLDVWKFWKSLKLATEGLDAGSAEILADYRTDSSTTWIPLPDEFDTSEFQEINITSDGSSEGRNIEIRLRMRTEDNTTTMAIYAMVVKSLIVFEVKFSWPLTFRAKDNDVDLNGDPDPMGCIEKLQILDQWVREATPVLMNGLSELEDGVLVKPEPVPVRRQRIILDDEHQELYVCQLTLLEV